MNKKTKKSNLIIDYIFRQNSKDEFLINKAIGHIVFFGLCAWVVKYFNFGAPSRPEICRRLIG
jgi:hypothetical protein